MKRGIEGRAAGARLRSLVIGAVLLSVVPSGATGETFGVLHGFDGPPANPSARVIEGSDGLLYGITQGGGSYGFGAIFRTGKDGSGFRTLHDFKDLDGQYPLAGLLEGTDGSFYGTTYNGGPFQSGVVFRMSGDGTKFSILHNFIYGVAADGISPVGDLLEASDGILYGTTQLGGAHGAGILFKINKDGSGFKNLHDFEYGVASNGASPLAGVVEGPDGVLYGTAGGGGAYGGGIVFRMNKDGSAFLNLHDFITMSGASPEAPVLVGSDGALYGTTFWGGEHGNGIVFKLNRDGTEFLELHDLDFRDGSGLKAGLSEGPDSALYGTTWLYGPKGGGTVFKIAKDGSAFRTIHSFDSFDKTNGSTPEAEILIATDGALYSTTFDGGSGGAGIVFTLAPDGAGFSRLHDFSFGGGARPYAAVLLGSDSALYGTSRDGGTYGYGTLFKLSNDGTDFSVIHEFSRDDGANPQASLVEASDGALYGTTFAGGAGGYGTAFRIEKDGSGLLTLRAFNGDSNGGNPSAALVEGLDGALYGTTRYSGANLAGVVFKVNKDGTGFTNLHDFTNQDGARPYAGLVEGLDGILYGTTRDGGAYGRGAVFAVNEDGTGFFNLHHFNESDVADGASPEASLLEASDGALYGTTTGGGLFWSGTLFKVSKDGSGFLNLHDFNQGEAGDGSTPQAGLVESVDGALYGTTSRGGFHDLGILFKINKDGSGFEKVHDFNYDDASNGANPQANLVLDADGTFYGTALYGGPAGAGVVFRLAAACEASVQVVGDVYAPGDTVPVDVHIAHHRPKTVIVPWELSLLDPNGQVVKKRTTQPRVYRRGDVVDSSLMFALPPGLESGTYTVRLAIAGMDGTHGAITTLRVEAK